MITDEQVKAAVSTYHDAYHHHPQIMADMRKALEAYEASKLDKISQQKDN